MNTKILNREVQDYIISTSDRNIDLSTLILKGSPFQGITIQELAQQVQGRLKAKQKLPSWYNTQGIYYPPTLNLEQTSSEATAQYKSNLVSGETLIDITGGLGIDDYYFSKKIIIVYHCELNEELSQIASHNFIILKTDNIKIYTGDGLEILKNQNTVDWIYIDPSRRHNSKGKVFFLEDCLPDVPSNLDFLFSRSKNILIKTSPLLDIQIGISSLKKVKEIHVVAVNNEVKELLWVLDSTFNGDIIIKTVNLTKTGNKEFSFLLKDETNISVPISLPKTYLYEPNAAILKSGGFSSIGKKLGLYKLHINSHLYTSDQLINFPGRRFQIINIYPYQKKVLAKAGITKANITTRNFPESVSVIRKKLKIKDGGQEYLFFTTNSENKKVILHCQKA
ncbi:class I SAM-dependent methyltransferase [Aquimarina sp. MMG016]|uniref:class I SAM-dependent methyltransferase n=1 Tax=Aquimarina sp. MMG016 TaxID=2822690 RepID=UPI001B3A42E9|nr:class I SAM-dependent methyltransferase [Aquimarina sp. MMG016]MBQ4821358.1 class I SAM-dependent methyltransferase [Aquimarina sp. MMG016]